MEQYKKKTFGELKEGDSLHFGHIRDNKLEFPMTDCTVVRIKPMKLLGCEDCPDDYIEVGFRLPDGQVFFTIFRKGEWMKRTDNEIYLTEKLTDDAVNELIQETTPTDATE